MMITIAALALAQGMGSVQDFALAGETAYLMLPPKVVCSGTASQLAWNADGSKLLVRRTLEGVTPRLIEDFVAKKAVSPPKPKDELLIWDARTEAVRTVWSSARDELNLTSADWLQGSPYVLVTYWPRNEDVKTIPAVAAVHTVTGRTQVVHPIQESEGLRIVIPSPTRAMAAIVFNSQSPSSSIDMWLVDGSLRLRGPFKIDQQIGNTLQWSSDGTTLYGAKATRPTSPGVRVRPAWFSFNARTGLMDTAASGPEYKAQEIEVRHEHGPLPNANTLWLAEPAAKPPAKSGLITADGVSGELSPTRNAVAYIHKGAVLVRPIAKMPKSAYEDALRAAERTVALSNAKQAVLAAIIYSADHDDMLPPPEGWQDKVGPYARNQDIIAAFNYTFGGGSLNDIEKPAETEIGYVNGPGGRAVAYADGHVKWIPDK